VAGDRAHASERRPVASIGVLDIRPFRIPGAIGHLGDYRRLAADRRALILLQNLWKPVNKVLTCTENAEEPEVSTTWAK
jgi:hypothetical protein